MIRVRLTLPPAERQDYRYYSVIHDCIVQAFLGLGLEKSLFYGPSSGAWTFAALRKRKGARSILHGIVISSWCPKISRVIEQLRPVDLVFSRSDIGESIDLSSATIRIEQPPIAHGSTSLGAIMLSPLVVRRLGSPHKKWHRSLMEFDITQAVNNGLSKRIGRQVALQVYPDSLYLRGRPDHAALVPMKPDKSGSTRYTIGMVAPMVLRGSTEDLAAAWFAGIGEKTRTGFGCLGAAEWGGRRENDS